MRAILCGTFSRPEVHLVFGRADVHAATGVSMAAWVRSIPGCRWDRAAGAWVLTALGPRYRGMLSGAGFALDNHLPGAATFADAVLPLVELVSGSRRQVQVWPRLFGFTAAAALLPETAPWQKGKGHWLLSLADVTGDRLREGFRYEQTVLDAAEDARRPRRDLAATAVPDWFGLALDPEQVDGALAMTRGTLADCDPMGFGKTRSILAAAAAVHADRTLIVAPPAVLTHWERESRASRLPAMAPRFAAGGPPDRYGQVRGEPGADIVPLPAAVDGGVVVLMSSRKPKPLPDAGVVVVADSMVAARRDLQRQLGDWLAGGATSVFAYDEVHRAGSWGTLRSTAAIGLASRATGLSIAASGTPMRSNPVEMASMLGITGDLDRVFGGWLAYSSRYARVDKFGGWRPVKARLDELRGRLDGGLWLRRKKPPGTGKRRSALFVDVDPGAYADAYRRVLVKVDEFLDDFAASHGRRLTTSERDRPEITRWCEDSIGLLSLLREAAGLAKVPVVAEMLRDWVAGADASVDERGRTVYDRPLTLWVWHDKVARAMVEAASAVAPGVRSILGGQSPDVTGRVVDDFQAGVVPALVLEIAAAGAGITLTRGSDTWAVETDWTPALIAQFEDRHNRRGQTRPVSVVTMIAEGTLDERIQRVLRTKAADLERVMPGGDHHVAVLDGDDLRVADILSEIVARRVKRHGHRPRTESAA